MKTIPYRIALFGFALMAIALAAALTLGFIELLSHVDLGRLGADASHSSIADAQAGSTQAALIEGLGVFEMTALWIVSLASIVAVLVLPMAGLVLLGVGGVCLRGSVAGLLKPSAERVTWKESAGSEDGYADAEPVFGVSPLLRKLKPAFLS